MYTSTLQNNMNKALSGGRGGGGGSLGHDLIFIHTFLYKQNVQYYAKDVTLSLYE